MMTIAMWCALAFVLLVLFPRASLVLLAIWIALNIH